MGLFEKIKDAFKEEDRTNDLCEHLRQFGVKATVIDTKSPEAVHYKPTMGIFGNPPLGCVKIEGRNLELVELYRVITGGGGPHSRRPSQIVYHYNYVVKAEIGSMEEDLKAEIQPIEKGMLRKEIVDFEWKGGRLAQQLNTDSDLRKMIIESGLPHLVLNPDKKDACVTMGRSHQKWHATTIDGISAKYNLTMGEKGFPSREAFEIYDRIAKHVHDIIDTPKP